MLKLMRKLKPYAWPIIGALLLVLVNALCDLNLPDLMANIINKGVLTGDTGVIYSTGLQMLAVSCLGMIATIGASFLASRVGMSFGRDLRGMVFTQVTDSSLRGFDKIGTASLITRTTNDITQMQMVITMMIRMMASAPMMAIGGTIMALRQDTGLAPILVVAIAVLLSMVGILAGIAIPYFTKMQQKIDKLNQVLRESLTGIRVIRAFRQESREEKRFDAANRDLTSIALRVNNIMVVAMPLMMLLMNGTVIAILWFGGVRIESGAMQVGSMMAFIQYAMQIMFSMLMLAMVFIMVPRASASAKRINEVMAIPTEIKDAPNAITEAPLRGTLSVEDVTFRYDYAEHPALEHVSFSAEPGQTTAIIGSTGSGKSTLLSLILRFYDVESGCIKVDGVDVRQFSQEALRGHIGYVPQVAALFSGSIADNLRMGRAEATDDELTAAAVTAQAWDFIQETEGGLYAQVAQGGTNFSGGQKQRLSIARALARKPDIFLFDDSFSALDYATDARLRAALREQTREATIVIVAQRVATVMDADRIVVLDDGKIVGVGRHKELLDTCEVYHEIVLSQLSEEEIA